MSVEGSSKGSRRRVVRGRELRFDVLTAIVLFAVGMTFGTVLVSRRSSGISFYELAFGPAVTVACGRGFLHPDVTRSTKLQAFLEKRSPSMIPSDLPQDVGHDKPYHTNFQNAHRYLMWTVGQVWRLRGISWVSLYPLFGLLYGASIALSFGLFRLGMNRKIAALMAVAFALSPFHFSYLLLLRDYAKAPFILAPMVIIGYLVSRPLHRSQILSLSALCGIVAGLGVGFRMDSVIGVPAFLIAVLFFLPGRLRKRISSRFLSIAIFLVCFALCSWPIYSQLKGGNLYHVTLMGLAAPLDQQLGVTTPYYNWGYWPSDTLARSILGSYANCATGQKLLPDYFTSQYDHIGVTYLMEIARNFPADMLTRFYAVVVRVLEMPFLVIDPGMHRIARLLHTNLDTMAASRPGFFHLLQLLISLTRSSGIAACVVGLLIVTRRNPKMAVFLAFTLIYYCGYGVLEFALRNVFHLQVIPLWGFGFLLQQAVLYRGRKERAELDRLSSPLRRWRIPAWDISARRMSIMAIAGLILVFCPLCVLRWYQQSHVRGLCERYTNATMQRLPVIISYVGADRVLVKPTGLFEDGRGSPSSSDATVLTEYLAFEIKNNPEPLPVVYRYSYKVIVPSRLALYQHPVMWDQSGTAILKLPAPAGGQRSPLTTRIYFPVFAEPHFRFEGMDVATRFEGLELPRKDLSRVVSIQRLTNPCVFPLRLWLTLGPGWQAEPACQAFSEW